MFKHRHLIVKRREKLTRTERDDLVRSEDQVEFGEESPAQTDALNSTASSLHS